MVGMGAVLLDAARLPQTSLALDSIDGGEWGASDALIRMTGGKFLQSGDNYCVTIA